MDLNLKNDFLHKWDKYFGNAELPLVFYYSDGDGGAEHVPAAKGWTCLVAQLVKVRKGASLCFSADSIGCNGGKRHTGYSESAPPDFEYFISCGIEGKVRGERYKKDPETVKEWMTHHVTIPAAGKNLVFKRWDNLDADDEPEVVIFFAEPDVLSGIFTLCNFDWSDPNGVISPFGAGCASIVLHPWLEMKRDVPRGVIGMFDPSARPFVGENTLSFAVPMKRFEKLVGNMDESFLVTETWERIRKRING